MKGDAAEGVGARRGPRPVTRGGFRERGWSEGPELKGRRADGLWEKGFGLRGQDTLGERLCGPPSLLLERELGGN